MPFRERMTRDTRRNSARTCFQRGPCLFFKMRTCCIYKYFIYIIFYMYAHHTLCLWQIIVSSEPPACDSRSFHHMGVTRPETPPSVFRKCTRKSVKTLDPSDVNVNVPSVPRTGGLYMYQSEMFLRPSSVQQYVRCLKTYFSNCCILL